jgi:hypothetical protein
MSLNLAPHWLDFPSDPTLRPNATKTQSKSASSPSTAIVYYIQNNSAEEINPQFFKLLETIILI